MNCYIINNIFKYNLNVDMRLINGIWNKECINMFSLIMMNDWKKIKICAVYLKEFIKKFIKYFSNMKICLSSVIFISNNFPNVLCDSKMFDYIHLMKKIDDTNLILTIKYSYKLLKNIYKIFNLNVSLSKNLNSDFNIFKFIFYFDNAKYSSMNVVYKTHEIRSCNKIKKTNFMFENVGYAYECEDFPEDHDTFRRRIDWDFDYVFNKLVEKCCVNKNIKFMFKRKFLNIVKYCYGSLKIADKCNCDSEITYGCDGRWRCYRRVNFSNDKCCYLAILLYHYCIKLEISNYKCLKSFNKKVKLIKVQYEIIRPYVKRILKKLMKKLMKK